MNRVASAVQSMTTSAALIKALAARAQQSGAVDALEDAAHLLLDQARLVEGEPPADALQFAQRLAKLMEKAI